MKKRIFAVLLSILLIFSLMPSTNVFATVYIDEDVTISDYDTNNTYYLTEDMVIEEGVTLTFDSNIYYFDLDGYTLSNYGEIDADSVRLYAYKGAFYNYGVYNFDEIFQYFTVYDLALSDIELSSGRINFEAGTREYAVTVDYSVTSIDVTPTLNTGTGVAYMTVNGTTVSSGAATTVSLSLGENTIRIVIKASEEGGGTTNTYTLTVTRENNEDYIISNANFVSAGGFVAQDMLQWSDVDAPGGYKLEIYTESGTRVYSGTLENNYTPASEVLTASGTYYFTVYALDADGNELSYKTSDTFTYTHTHSLTYVEAKDASCTEDGNTEYWYCSGCGKYFSDSSATAEISQSDTVISGHTYDTYGFCTICGGYQPATLNSKGVYEISNAGQLFWFAALVNGDTAQKGITAAVADANAVLTANIDLSVTTTTHTGTEWTPIGDYGSSTDLYYSGTFDGGSYTVSGLYISSSNGYQGLFGYIGSGGTVKNVTVSGSVSASENAGGVAGYNGGTVQNVAVSGSVTASGNYAGGSVGRNDGTVQDVTADVTVAGTNRIGGIVGFNDGGTVKYCINSGTVSCSNMNAGGVVGYNYNNGTVTDCYSSGNVSGSYIGGVVGWNSGSTVSNCYSSGNVSGDSNVGGVAGFNSSNGGTVTNCYSLEGTADTAIGSDNGSSTSVTLKTADEFASGEVAYLLNESVSGGTTWYQNIDNEKTEDSYPLLDSTHGTVYYGTDCANTAVYSNNTVPAAEHSYDTNGFCTICGAYEPAELNADGVYEISSAGQLFWFAALVNGDTAQEGITAADTSAGAVLTANIELDTTTTTHTNTEWTPIGTDSAPYTGTFDGGGYKISGLDITTAADYAGLFGYVTGTVKDLTVSGDINVSGDTMCVGGIVGTVKNGTLSGLTSYVDVTGYDGTKGMFGGVAATAEGTNNTAGSTVERCAYYGTVTASGALTSVGGIVGYMSAATITDCINYGTVDSTGATSAGDTNIYTGGIVSYCNNANAVVANCVNVGTISGAGANTADTCYTGAIIGRIKDSVEKVSNCYYLTDADSTLDGIAANGSGETADTSGKTADEFASGEVVWLLQDANTEYVWGQELDADEYPVLITDGDSESGKKVVRVVFYKASDSTVLMKSYTNTGNTVADYPSGSEYTFYSDSDLTQEISDISTVTFSSDTDIYVGTAQPVVNVDTDSYTPGTWTNTDVTIALSNGTDNSGETAFEYKVGDGEWQVYTEAITVSTETDGTVYTFRATSESGVVSETVSITVRIDRTAPDGDITIESNSVKELINAITFGLFFNKSVEVGITGSDDGSGVASVQYFRSEDILTESGVAAITDWTDYTSVICVTATDAAAYVYYVKVTDNAGNISYFGSDGMTFDLADPVIGGIEDGSTYCGEVEFTVTDDNLDYVEVNGQTVTDYTLEANGSEYEITAYDKAENSTTCTVTVNSGHSWDDGVVTEEATCIKAGVRTYTCTVCGETYTEAVEATGHIWDDGVVTRAATCTETGMMTYTCTACGDLYTEVIEATGHSYEAVITEPTCTENGYTTYTCSVCGDKYTADETEATGHNWDDGVVTRAATCTETGVKTYTCAVCGETYTEVIEATSHSWDDGVVTEEATCTEAGVRTYTCTVCGETCTEAIEATGHIWDEGVVTRAATCTETGMMTYTCTACGDLYTEVIEATGH
ncbi:MAG: cadherin-like beta sandwich domain-containing protein, partial [Clostridiales bacterium]|nr:cadherin-like beta sandwich domain-containing protein [Clostridiales bacterium]